MSNLAKIRSTRQTPTREPYSKADSTSGLRLPGTGGKPMSLSIPSEAGSPARMFASPPVS